MDSTLKVERINKIKKMLGELRDAKSALEKINVNLQQRYEELFQGCVANIDEGGVRAIVLANECFAVKKVYKITGQNLNAIDEAISALEKTQLLFQKKSNP